MNRANPDSFDSYLYVEERVVYNEFLMKGAKALDDTDLITVHGFLARCEGAIDRQRQFINIVEEELLFRLSQRKLAE
ncbi:MAG: hypothetical protein ACE5JV_01305 [Nitrososphaerales archaeon]